MSLLGKFSMEVAKRGERGGSASILFKGFISVFVNRNDTDEHRFLSYSIICEISEICVRNILVTLMTQITQIFFYNPRNTKFLIIKRIPLEVFS